MFLLIYFALLGFLVYLSLKPKKGILFGGVKCCCSVLFVFLFFSGNGTFSKVAALFCALGDVFLAFYQMNQKKAEFYLGLASFLLGHVFFLLELFTKNHFDRSMLFIPVLVLVLLYYLYQNQDSFLKRVPIVSYAFVISLLISASLNWLIIAPSMNSILFFIGSGLFFISDGILFFLYILKKKQRWLHPTNLILYYFAMIVIAFSMISIKN